MEKVFSISERYQRKISDKDVDDLSKIEGKFETARTRRQVAQLETQERSFLKGVTECEIFGVSLNSRDVSQKLVELQGRVGTLNQEVGQYISSNFIIDGKELVKKSWQLEEAQGKLQDLERGIELNARAQCILKEDEIGKLYQQIQEYERANRGKLDGKMLYDMALRLQEAQVDLQNLQKRSLEVSSKPLKAEEKKLVEEKKSSIITLPKNLPKEADDLAKAIEDLVDNNTDQTRAKLKEKAKEYYGSAPWGKNQQQKTGISVISSNRFDSQLAAIKIDSANEELLKAIVYMREPHTSNVPGTIRTIFADAIVLCAKTLLQFNDLVYNVDQITMNLFLKANTFRPTPEYAHYTKEQGIILLQKK